MQSLGKPALISTAAFVLSLSFIVLSTASFAEAREDTSRRSDIVSSIQKRVCERLDRAFSRLPVTPSLPHFCSDTPPPPPPSPTVDLTGTPSTISLGATSTLAWTSTNASSCTASGGWSGLKSLTGSVAVSPSATTVYTLACGNGVSTSTDSVTVTVTTPTPLPTVTLSATPSTIVLGATSTLTWTSANATTCVGSNGWSGTTSVSGTLVVSPATTTLYTLSCGNATGTTTATATLSVTPLPTPVVSLVAGTNTLVTGATTTLSWTSAHATHCLASQGWTGVQTLSGSTVIQPTTTTTYTLECGNSTSTSTDSVTVTVTQAPLPTPTVTIETDENTIGYEASALLTWSSENATQCIATNGWSGDKALDGNESVEPLATTTYTLSCGNGVSTSSDSVTVAVILPPAPTVLLTADPSEVIGTDDVTTLEWSSTNAATCTASGDWTGTRTTAGNEEVGPDETSEYVLTCTGPGGVGAATTTVVFSPSALNHLIISEVYYDTDATHGAEPGNEWVELYNPTNADVSLTGWSLTDGATTTDFITGAVTIEANSFALIVASTTVQDFWTFPVGVPVYSFASSIGNQLNNPGDSLYLMNNASTTIDAISWGANTTVMSPSIPGVDAGHSIARSSLLVDTDTASDWIDRETPTPGF